MASASKANQMSEEMFERLWEKLFRDARERLGETEEGARDFANKAVDVARSAQHMGSFSSQQRDDHIPSTEH